ncbi:hypothetical protein [Microbacterium xanthum]|uniref:hypothetical protein n=1 Tax=Microbacterium xanthum TaxID=3079794 RepID=UPI002AD43E8B|nr:MULTISPECIES: hypothetical protein [unclassified Microbacterium]MDZ8172454.1 hypothetical protein [Microbacterium sp. KSW-48]MDZ8202725.1 hypothetical protein [Microbacterium sp. SSW1-59]
MESSLSPVPPSRPASTSESEDPIDLVSRLEVIEAQPLATRADAFAAIHDELSARLDADVTGRPARS